MSQDFPRAAQPGRRPSRPTNGRLRALIPTVIVLVVLGILFAIFTSIWTERLWFRAVDYSEVFSRTVLTRTGLFVVFGLLMGLAVAVNGYIAYRLRPRTRPSSLEQQSLDRYRDAIDPIRRWLLIGIATLFGLLAGGSASGQWRTFMQWRYGQSFGTKDPQFHMDVSFYAFNYPFYRFLLNFGFVAIVLAFAVAIITHYVYGAIRLQTNTAQKVTGAAQGHLSVLIGLFVLLKAIAYWLDRYALVLGDNRLFTGASYSDVNAQLPAKTTLTFIALICAILFFANAWRRSWTLPGISFGLLVLSALLLGAIWPLIVQQFQVKPNEADKESTYIQRNLDATKAAYGIGANKVKTAEYNATTSTSPGQLADSADTVPGIRLLDPSLVSSTFQNQQQVRGFYKFTDPLDVDRYQVDGVTRDMVVAAREIDINGLPSTQKNWINQHTVYTHGFGVVAAYGNQRAADGSPVYAEQDIPPDGVLGTYEPRIYFGENSPDYSIVGSPKSAKPVEFDIPEDQANNNQQRNTTYTGGGGVPIGGLFNKVLYAAKYQEANFLLSSRVNADSQILYERDPKDRLHKVAPWLHVDGNPYPAVVDGKVLWILDGYTTLDSYPYSQRVELDQLTNDSRVRTPGVAAQPQDNINYVRNSVKATVNAYDGTVTLYAWDSSDPVLKTWEKVYPGTVKPKSAIPGAVLDHMRYPEDVFKLQRGLLQKYHVTSPNVFYSQSDQWVVPSDPTKPGGLPQPPYYLSVRMPDQDQAQFSLTSTFVPNKRQNLAAFAAVDANARSADYGTIRLLRLPSNTQIDGPNQVANNFDSNQDIAAATLPLRNSGASTSDGNLLTLPVGGGLLYVEPVYVQRRGTEVSYPLLRLVYVSFGGKVGVGDTLQGALDQIFAGSSGTNTGETSPPATGGPTPTPTPAPGGGTTDTLKAAVADAQKAFNDAQSAQKAGDWTAYGEALTRLSAALTRATALGGTPAPASTASPSPSPSAAAAG